MSRNLSSIFGSSSTADSGSDALKFTAPKELRRGSSTNQMIQIANNTKLPGSNESTSPESGTPTSATAPQSNPSIPSNVAIAKQETKILASASVHLYKSNSSNQYESVEGGSLLGCVLLGAGSLFQILVYNGKKVPQLTLNVTSRLQYAIRDLYVSLTDPETGQHWSLLFELMDTMTLFLRALVACILSLISSSPSTTNENQIPIKFSLPVTNGAIDDTLTLSQNMTAGVYITAWTTVTSIDSLGGTESMFQRTPLLEVQPPREFEKIKIGISSDQQGTLLEGLSEALEGSHKGERVLVCLPPLASPSNRQSWIVADVLIHKVKIAQTSTQVKPLSTLQSKSQLISNQHANSQNQDISTFPVVVNGSGDNDSIISDSSETLHHQQITHPDQNGLTSRMAKLSSIARGSRMPISYLPSSSTSTEYINTTSTRTHNNNVNSTSNDPINQNTDHITTIVPSNAQNLTSHQSNQNQIQTHQYRQQNLVNEHPSTHQQYSVALVDGQGVRSYYSSSTGSAPDRDHTVPPPPDNSDHTVHTTYSYPYGYPSPAHTDKGTGTVERETVATAHALQTIQTMILQMSGKIDQLGYQTSLTAKNQSGFHQLHSALLLTTHGSSLAVTEGMKHRAQEAMTQLHDLLSEYDSVVSTIQSQPNAGTFTSADINKEQQKYQDKIESLTNKVEKLMDEKAALLDKQAQLQSQLQQMGDALRATAVSNEAETLKREKALLEAAVSKLEIKNSSEQNLSDEVSSINTTKIKDLEIELQHVKETLSDVALLRKNDLERHVIEVETVRKEKELALAQVRESDSQYATLFSGMVRQLQALVGSCNNAEQVIDTEVETNMPENEKSNYEVALTTIRQRLNASAVTYEFSTSQPSIGRDNLNDDLTLLRNRVVELDSINKQLSSQLNSLLQGQQLQKLQPEYSGDRNDKDSTSIAFGADKLKEVMQDIYARVLEVFTAEENEEGYTVEVIHREIRSVLKQVTANRLAVPKLEI